MSLAEAIASAERASAHLAGFKKCKTGAKEHETIGFKGALSSLRFPPGVDLIGISEIQATMRTDRNLASLQRLFRHVRPNLGVPCSLAVGAPMQKVTKSWGRGFITSVSVGCEIAGDKTRLLLSTDAAKLDVDLLRDFFARLAGELMLPLQCIDHDPGFALAGKGSARVEMILTQPNGANPQGFRIALPKLSWDDAPMLLWAVIQNFSGNQVSLDWTLQPRPASMASGGLRLLDAAARAKWPADSYEVSIEYRLQTVEALDLLQKLLRGNKGQFRTCLADFVFDDREDGQVGIRPDRK